MLYTCSNTGSKIAQFFSRTDAGSGGCPVHSVRFGRCGCGAVLNITYYIAQVGRLVRHEYKLLYTLSCRSGVRRQSVAPMSFVLERGLKLRVRCAALRLHNARFAG
jgi:hypothetical protein